MNSMVTYYINKFQTKEALEAHRATRIAQIEEVAKSGNFGTTEHDARYEASFKAHLRTINWMNEAIRSMGA